MALASDDDDDDGGHDDDGGDGDGNTYSTKWFWPTAKTRYLQFKMEKIKNSDAM